MRGSGARGALRDGHVPQLLQPIKLAHSRQHHVHNHFIQVDENPIAVLLTLDAVRPKSRFLGLFDHALRNRPHMTIGRAARNHHEIGNIGQANYAASKSGLFGLTKTFAREAAFLLERSGKLDDDSIGITVNTVTPGYTWTEMVAAVPEKVLDKLKAQIPLRRFGRPEEVARIVGFLSADESSYITGQVWGVNGGMDM